jgi:hypothetical protein
MSFASREWALFPFWGIGFNYKDRLTIICIIIIIIIITVIIIIIIIIIPVTDVFEL